MFRRMCFGLFGGAVALIATAMPAHAVTLGTYDFNINNQAGGATPGLTFSAFQRTGVTAAASSGDLGVFESASWGTGDTIDLGKYVWFTVTVDAGYSAQLTSLAFQHERAHGPGGGGGNKGPLAGEIRLGELFAATDFSFDPDPETTALPGSENWTFGSPISLNAGDTLEFRLYGYDAGSAANWMWFDNVALSGAVTETVVDPGNPGGAPGDPVAVPEPATAALAGLAGLALLAVGRRRR